VAALAAMLGLVDGAWAQPAMWQGYAQAAIAAHARRVGGQAPRESRKTCEGDVNGDGKVDAAVIYTIEGVGGGNGWTQYILLMVAAPQGVGATNPKEVGATGKRSLESCTLTAGTIDAAIKEWAPADPSCCPSKTGTLKLGFEKGKVVDAPVAAAPAPAPSAP
jgi:hypothetical protein